MKLTSEYIQQLLIEKVTGTISADNNVVIERLLVEDAAVGFEWETIQKQVQEAKARGFSIDGNADESWQQIAKLIKRPERVRLFSLVKVAAAAAILAIIASIYLFNKNHISAPVAAKVVDKDDGNEIALSIDNGETLYLKNAGDNTFKLGNAIIKTHENTLSFTYTKAETKSWNTLKIPAVKDYKIVLSDGTIVWMNSNTILHFPFRFTNKRREVYIDGEAYFDVAKNAHQPFVVHTGKMDIRVFGTRFNVNTYNDDEITTALVEGAVAVSANDRQVNLKPGFKAVYSTLNKGCKLTTFEADEVLSWMKGVYYFHNTPLSDLSKLLARWYNVQVKFDKAQDGNKTFTGMIVKNQPLQLFLGNIKMSNNINADFRNQTVYFR